MFEEIVCDEDDIKNICKFDGDNPVSMITAWKVSSYEDICNKNDTWELGTRIGELSMFGSAHLAHCKKDKAEEDEDEKTYVFKIINLTNSDYFTKFNKEIYYQKKAAELGVASPVYQVFIDKKKTVGMFVMDLYTTTVQTFFVEQLSLKNPDIPLLKKIYDRCLEINEILESSNIFHNDQHLNNFMLKSLGPIDIQDVENNVKIIDFGEARSEKLTDMSKKIEIVSMPSLRECVKVKNQFLDYILPPRDSVKKEDTNEIDAFKIFIKDLNHFYDDLMNFQDRPSRYTNPKNMKKYEKTYDKYIKLMKTNGFSFLVDEEDED